MESANDNRNPVYLVKKLCMRVTGMGDDCITSQFQYALRILGSNVTTPLESDEFEVAEKIKRKLVRQHREKDAALFSELHRKLQSQDIIKNRWGILYLLLNLCEDKSKSATKATFRPNLFNKGLLHGQTTTSTPMDARSHIPPATETPAVDVSRSRSAISTGSSGISSIPSGHTTDPSPLPQSFAPSYLPTPGVGKHSSKAPMLPRLAWSTSKLATSDTTNMSVALRDRTIARSDKDGRVNTTNEIPESVLLRELVYVLQGIEGTMIKFEVMQDGYKVDHKLGIPMAMRKTVNKLVECGWLFNKIRKYTDARSSEKAFGLVGQSFCASLHQELTEYYRLMAVLEAQLQQEDDQGISVGSAGLTLRRLALWTADPMVRLKALAALVDVCKGKKGGELGSAIHSYVKHGDPFVQSLVKHTLTLVAQPIFSIVTRWIYDGVLEDTYHEFFVASDPSISEDKLWHEKYSLRKSMIPSFISMDQARKMLLTGKSINFLRQLCHDRTRISGMNIVKASENFADTMFTQDYDGNFQQMIDTAYNGTSKHLLEVLHEKYKFMDHLKAMRRYLLLGQGDFIRHLMDLLEEDLAKPASMLYLHNLTGILETAIRATNAQFDDADILKRLDVRLLEVSPGDTGWDVFSLDYHVDGPIKTVFTPECMIMYLRVFNFLWRAKRMEYTLAGIWKGQISNARLLRNMPEVGKVLHQCHTLGCEMIHFVQQVQYYINFEVLECSWHELLRKVLSAKDLDYIIAAHQEFLDAVLTRSLLDEQSKGILTQLRTIFDLIIQFQGVQDKFYDVCLEEQDTRNTFIAKRDSKKADKGVTQDDIDKEEQRKHNFMKTSIPSTRARMKVLSQSYQDMAQQFLVMLHDHSDLSLRFLSFRLDFNEHYRAKEPKLRSPFGVKQRRHIKPTSTS